MHVNGILVRIVVTLLLGVTPHTVWAGGGHDHGHGHGHQHGGHAHNEPARGPHGGRLLTSGGFSLEITIFERGIPPEFRLYPFHDGKPLAPESVTASITLQRFGREREEFTFSPREDYLASGAPVAEPHSFDLDIRGEYKGVKHTWKYQSHEGRTELSEEARKVADLRIDRAGPHTISNSTRVYGRILANEDRVAHVSARFPGIVRDIHKTFGDKVAKGEVLARVESNQNLQVYEIRSEIGGVIIQRHATLGEVVSDARPLFVVVDLSQVWADFQVYRDDVGEIAVGQSILIELSEGREPIEAKVSYVSPITDEATQSKLIRVVLPNPAGELRPGLFVSGVLNASSAEVPLAVRREAIQTFRDWDVVYVTDGHIFQAMPVKLGRRDSRYVEVLSGIQAGERYVSKNSFIIKADIEKAGASHDH